jgi:hypothetical protein
MPRPKYSAVDREAFGDGRYAEERICDENGALRIWLEDEGGKKLTVTFNAYLAYRKMDEGDALATLADMEESDAAGTMLYSVIDSEYLRWFHFESESMHKAQTLLHYCLTTIDSVIDVISFDPPAVTP